MSTFKSFAAAVVTVFAIATSALSAEVDFANAAFAPTGAETSIPVGAAEFCKSHRGECKPNRDVIDAMPLNEQRWGQLVDINNAVNSAVVAVTDAELYKVEERWAYPSKGYGDCEDFALAKRHALIANGWHPSTLMIAAVREQDGNGHAVLMVRTDRGDLVLDNQDGRILLWNQTPYQYLKRQSQADAGRWIDLLDDRNGMMVAAR